MSVVLVVEPDPSHAEALRKALRRVPAELLLVSSTRAAITAVERSVPDLVLISALLSPRDEDALFAQLRVLEGASHLQTLTIPQLRKGKESAKKGGAALGGFRKKSPSSGPAGCEPAVFADQVRSYLARAHEVQRHVSELAAQSIEPPMVVLRHVAESPFAGHASEASGPNDEPMADEMFHLERAIEMARPAAVEAVEPETYTWQPSYTAPAAAVESTIVDEPYESAPAESLIADAPYASMPAESLIADEPYAPVPVVPDFSPAYATDAAPPAFTPSWTERMESIDPPVKVSRTLEEISLTWLDDDRADTPQNDWRPAGTPAITPVMSDDPWIDLNVDALAKPAEPRRAEPAHRAEDVQAQLAEQIQRFELKAQEVREVELIRVQAEAQARLTAEVERVQAEAEERRLSELARVQAEAEVQRDAAVNEARAAAEAEARSSVIAELEQVRVNEIARVQAEADVRCDTVARQAREAAEAEAARAMTEELARIRTQVEQKLNSQLEHARAEAEQLREAERARAQIEAAAIRDAAAKDARAAVETAANLALEAEVARVRADAETQLRAELNVIRQEAEHLRRADRSEAKHAVEKVHAAAVRDARAIAEAANQTLEAELVRVRVEADERLEAELSRARAEAERQRAAELEEIRAQVAEMRETASQQARRAAADAIASEVARGVPDPPAVAAVASSKATLAAITPVVKTPVVKAPFVKAPIAVTPIASAPIDPKPAVASSSGSSPAGPGDAASDYYSLWKPLPPLATLAPEGSGDDVPRTIVTFVRSKWALPVAAALLLVVGNGITVGRSWRPSLAPAATAAVVTPVEKRTARVAEEVAVKTGELKIETTPAGARVLLDGTAAGKTPLTVSKLKPGAHTLVLQGSSGTLSRKIVVRAGETTRVSESIFSGWLALFAPIPLHIYVDGQLRGSTEDGQVMLTPGKHIVLLVSERFNYKETKSFTIEPGGVATYSITLPTSVVRVNSPDGASISIDGAPVGRAPLGDLPVTIGTHEVAMTSAELGERRQSVEVRLGVPTEVTLR